MQTEYQKQIESEFKLQGKLATFAYRVQQEQILRLHAEDMACAANVGNAITSIKPGKKYTKVDIGGSGRYMVVNETGEIFGVKAYGVIHRGHPYGTLDTIDDWDWGGYYPRKK